MKLCLKLTHLGLEGRIFDGAIQPFNGTRDTSAKPNRRYQLRPLVLSHFYFNNRVFGEVPVTREHPFALAVVECKADGIPMLHRRTIHGMRSSGRLASQCDCTIRRMTLNRAAVNGILIHIKTSSFFDGYKCSKEENYVNVFDSRMYVFYTKT